MYFSPQGQLPSWPPDYICYAIELHKKYDEGLLSKAEAMCRLREKFPGYDEPTERTWPRWAHGKYGHLPEQRQRYLSPQASGVSRSLAPVPGYREIQRPVEWLTKTWVMPSQMVRDMMNWMAFFILMIMYAAMVRTAIR
jgi:hypothetical protein